MSRRRPERALTPETDFALSRMAYLRRYDDDAAFCAALEDLYLSTVGSAPPLDPDRRAWVGALPEKTYIGPPPVSFPLPTGPGEYHRYRQALDDFVVEWGLDRLEGSPSEGLTDGGDYVNDWCMVRQRWPESTPASEFSIGRGWAEPLVAIGTAVTVAITGTWDPRRERQRDAQRRFERLAAEAVRARLEYVALGAERAGLRFLDTSPARNRHLDWIFQLATNRTTVSDLASTSHESEDAIARAVTRMARRLRVRTDGWYVTGRTSRPHR